MKRNKSAISKASSYKEVGEYWDNHDLSKVWSKTKKVRFDVRIETEATYCAIEKSLSEKVQSIAKKKGLSTDTLVNRCIQQKLQEQAP
jgi:predicted HicB family RNase H-like nuclease